MRISYLTVRNWLELHGPHCRLDELQDLSALLSELIRDAEALEARKVLAVQELRAVAEQRAAEIGVPVQELLRLQFREIAPQPFPTGGSRSSARPTVRRPFMNPYADDGQIYADHTSHPSRKAPAWWERAQREGISMAMCHHSRLLDTWRATGLPVLYPDPTARHREIVEEEMRLRPRKPRNRKPR